MDAFASPFSWCVQVLSVFVFSIFHDRSIDHEGGSQQHKKGKNKKERRAPHARSMKQSVFFVLLGLVVLGAVAEAPQFDVKCEACKALINFAESYIKDPQGRLQSPFPIPFPISIPAVQSLLSSLFTLFFLNSEIFEIF
jgi:hypothetical protein